ncbi:hypothetical protein [Calothrix sp. UHCC 0171]|uniref:hypothetical protein n=1 Tax=Calothrix sp. UHCC 0171 TaxID=3110245 RepID=UPI002B218165|nr:hypothetical protein [Calothrix sp. UHCC 0171]MEA5574100.1 hypothetical protein [Calothrix sp. UHCC 0171]
MRDARQFNFNEGFDTFGVPDALPQLPLFVTTTRKSQISIKSNSLNQNRNFATSRFINGHTQTNIIPSYPIRVFPN